MKKIINKISLFMKNIIPYIEKILKNKYLYYIIFILFAILLYYLNFKNELNKLGIRDNKYLFYFKIGIAIITIIIILLLIINNKFKRMSISKKYLLIGLILGLTYVFASPVFTQSDESFHFIRAYQISKGNLISPYDADGNSYDEFPKSIYKVLYDDDDKYPEYKTYIDSYNENKIKLEKNNTVKKDVRASNYVFLNYLPHAIGIRIGTMFNLSPYMLGLFGRILNTIFCIVIISYGLKMIPICKKALTVLLLCPSVIAYIASLSADGLIIATTFLLVSFVIKYIHDKSSLGWKNYLLFFVIVAFVSTCKAAYLPIIGILIFLPNECFKNKKSKWIFSLSLIFLGIFMSLIWMNIGRISVETMNSYSGLHKYIRFGYVFSNTLINNFGSYIKNIFAGNYMYQCQVNPFEIIPLTYLVLFIVSIFSDENNLKISFFNKLIVVGISTVVIALIAYALFTSNTDLNSTLINGIQGRYFVPIVLLLPFFTSKKRFDILDYNLINISLIMNLYVLFNIIYVFIV